MSGSVPRTGVMKLVACGGVLEHFSTAKNIGKYL